MVYDYALSDYGTGAFQQTPSLARAYQDARTYYFDSGQTCLGTVTTILNKDSTLRNAVIHPDSKRFILYLGDYRMSRITRLTITRDARYHGRPQKHLKHNLLAWDIRLRNGLADSLTNALGEFEGHDCSDWTTPVGKPMHCWDEAPRPHVVLRRLADAGETTLTVQNLMCLMSMMCGHRYQGG